MENLKILMVVAFFYPFIGGAEKQAQKLALELLKLKLEVTVVTGRWSNLLKKNENIQGLKIIRNLTNFKFYNNSTLCKGTDNLKSTSVPETEKKFFLKSFFNKIFKRISIYIYQISLFLLLLKNRNKYDLIHVHQALYPAFISAVVARLFKKPIIVKIGSSGFNSDINQIKKYPEGRFQLRFILNNIDKLVCTSNKMQEEFLLEGIDRNKIILIPNGVIINNFNRTYNVCDTLIYVGRFEKIKNIETLIVAFSKIIQNINSNLKLNLVGDGSEKNNIIDLIKRLHLDDNILLSGFVDNPGLFLQTSDLFIIPSLIEGLSNSLLEAMSYKLPCIASNIPGNSDVINGDQKSYNILKGDFKITDYGILFKSGDVEGLYSAIKFLINSIDMRKSLGESAFEKVKNDYDINTISKRYINLYKEVLK